MLSVRELKEADIDLISRYWTEADKSFLLAMGVDHSKLPSGDSFTTMLKEQINIPLKQKRSYCIIWQADGVPVGHSNTNPTYYGNYAFMHMHIWQADGRAKGKGTEFVKLTLPYFFEKLQINELYCQPYALNPAPNKTLAKLGFELEKEYVTVPGVINFEQPVKLWKMSKANFKELISKK